MKEYLEEETCLKVSMKETDKYYEKLPLMYKGRYIFLWYANGWGKVDRLKTEIWHKTSWY